MEEVVYTNISPDSVLEKIQKSGVSDLFRVLCDVETALHLVGPHFANVPQLRYAEGDTHFGGAILQETSKIGYFRFDPEFYDTSVTLLEFISILESLKR